MAIVIKISSFLVHIFAYFACFGLFGKSIVDCFESLEHTISYLSRKIVFQVNWSVDLNSRFLVSRTYSKKF